MEQLVSIIVPVYNAKEYLKRCVDSILVQDYPHFELLLMDDGSTDGSAAICDAYAKQDERVRVIHKKNTGVSDTRNQALDLARGVYIQFLDSDDWIVPEATRLLVQAMEKYDCDMVISDFYRVAGERLAQKGDIEENRVLSRQEFAACMIENPADFYYGVLWNKLYKREIIEENRIRMDVSLSWCEDFLFNLEYIRHCSSFYALQVPIYYYVKRKGSLVSQGMSISNTMRMKINIFDYYNEFYKDVYDHEDYANIRLQVYSFLWAAAKDGVVPPAPFPGGRKLGEERRSIRREQLEGEGTIMAQYRSRQLLDYQLDLAAKKNRLTIDEAKILFALYQCGEFEGMRRLSEVADLPLTRIFLALQKLERKNLVELTDDRSRSEKAENDEEYGEKTVKGKGEKKGKKEKKKKEKKKSAEKKAEKTGKGRDDEKKERNRIFLRADADAVCEEFGAMQEEMEKICFAGFTEEERREGIQLLKRMNDNIVRFMAKKEPQKAPADEEKPYTGYLFVHFTGEQPLGEQIYFSLSRDGMHWEDLNEGRPVLISNIGECGVRDPFILRNPLNGKYVIIATDLRIEAGKGWTAAQEAGSRCLIVWESDNMTEWEGPESYEVGIPEAGCVWAPEAIFDEEKQEFLVFWASKVKEEGDEESKQRIYASYTKDFHSFTPAVKYQEGKNHIIDTTILRADGYYYRFAKDETVKNIRLDRSKSLDKDSFTEVEAPVLNELMGVEGPAAFRFNDRKEWCLMVDRFAEDKGYLPLLSTDFGSGIFRIPEAGEYDLGKTKKRHGSILNLTEEEYTALAEKWKKQEGFVG